MMVEIEELQARIATLENTSRELAAVVQYLGARNQRAAAGMVSAASVILDFVAATLTEGTARAAAFDATAKKNGANS